MLEEKLVVSSSPHQRTTMCVDKIMLYVILALVPAVFAAVYFFGIYAIAIMATAVIAAVATEAFIVRFMLKREQTVQDGSAALTGLLLAMCLPPTIPLWTTALGAAFAVGVGKMAFGGIGCNIFNPAHVGRAFLLAAYPAYMTSWIWPKTATAVDALTSATPLALLKQDVVTPYWDLFIGNVGGSLGETSAVALLAGGLFLVYLKIIDWRIPATYLGTVIILSFVLGQDPIFHLLAGGLMIGAFFMATDYVTSPITTKGRIIFGVGCGLLTVLIRLFGGYPEGVCYSILLMNACVPLIDRYTVPRVYGEVKKK